ncbi:MAG TPA: PilZ domain-containing protein [Candidatus Deferrimicrobiaceae bacterium]|nr:PilZ domain-containing protein [Candidatus Deferrimicrobiaceae bacterium]
MNFSSLLVCSDERSLRVLSNVLSELEINVEHCPDHVSAARKLAQRSFEAVIVDCKDEHGFALLGSVRSGKQNSKSMAIAIIEVRTNSQTAFKLGANFVVFKPISTEKAKSSFRAARALMKRERRRNLRVQVNIAAYFRFHNGEGEHGSISGLSEGGMSVRFSSSNKKVSPIGFCFALPDTTTVIEADGTIAWQDTRRHAGLQFAALPAATEESLKEWLRLQSEEKRDPPIHCTLISLSFAGCFLRTQSAFPVQTRVELLLRAADYSVKTQGKVRFMDPELGMGIEFLRPTVRHRLEELIQQIEANPDAIAEVVVEPEGIDWENSVSQSSSETTGSTEDALESDPLLELFYKGATLTKTEFLVELGKHELANSPAGASKPDLAESIAYQRREPRLSVSLPVQMVGRAQQGPSEASIIDVSHRGARLDGTAFYPKAGEIVHLVSGGVDARFRVIWVGEKGTPQEGQIGLQGLTTDN